MLNILLQIMTLQPKQIPGVDMKKTGFQSY